MADTIRTRAALVSLLADNGGISPQNLRDFLISTGIAASGAGAPGSAPASLHDFYFDTTNANAYAAIATGASSDWKKINNDWKTLGTWTWSTNVASVDFTNLAPYEDLLFVSRDVTTSSSGQRALRFSTDNGSTFRSTSGDYVTIDNDGVETNVTFLGIMGQLTTAARSGALRIPQAGVSGIIKSCVATDIGAQQFFLQSTSPINALRFLNSAGNLTGGSAFVLGR